MKQNIRTLLSTSALIVCLTGFCSCSNNANSDKSIIDVASVVGKGSVHSASEFFKDIKYIPLETEPNSIIGNISKLYVENNKIYVSDIRGIINIFDMDGRHLSTLNKIGRGPEEYIRMNTFTVSPTGSIFVVLANEGIIEYNDDLKFVRRVNSDFPFGNQFDFSSLRKDLFASILLDFSYPNNRHTFLIYNDSLKIQFSDSSVLPMAISEEGRLSVRTNVSKFTIYNNELKIFRDGSDTIFVIDIDNNYSKSAKYILNYGGYSLSNDVINSLAGASADAKMISLLSMTESDNYLFMRFNFRGLAPEPFDPQIDYSGAVRLDGSGPTDKITTVNIIYNKKTGKAILLNQPSPGSLGLRDDLTGGPPFWPGIITAKQEFVTWRNAHDLISLAEEGKIDKSLVANLKENDNPVIVIATPK